MKKIVFTSGLPRSGSTLLSGILNQNPFFRSDATIPLPELIQSNIDVINSNGYYKSLFSDEKIDNILRSIIENFYDNEDKKVFFSHSKTWLGRTRILKRLYPDYKLIIMVRDVQWIMNSLEHLAQKNIYNIPKYSAGASNSNIYERCNSIINGLIPNCDYIKAIINENNPNVLIIEYDTLIQSPKLVMETIYSHINEPYFNHDFLNVTFSNKIFDIDVNMPGLHDVDGKLEYKNKNLLIPQDICDRVGYLNVWKT